MKGHILLSGALMMLFAGCAAEDASGTPGATASQAPQPLAVVAVGDSVTEADSPAFDSGVFGTGSWASAADRDGVDVLGGWAKAGALTLDMRDGVQPRRADALVVMAGTNDVRFGVAWEQSAVNLRQVVRTVGTSRVLVCAIVPLAEDPAGAEGFNDRLRDLSDAQGWEYRDCAADVRRADGQWLPGMSEDGIHPNVTGATYIGAAVHEALVG